MTNPNIDHLCVCDVGSDSQQHGQRDIVVAHAKKSSKMSVELIASGRMFAPSVVSYSPFHSVSERRVIAANNANRRQQNAGNGQSDEKQFCPTPNRGSLILPITCRQQAMEVCDHSER